MILIWILTIITDLSNHIYYISGVNTSDPGFVIIIDKNWDHVETNVQPSPILIRNTIENPTNSMLNHKSAREQPRIADSRRVDKIDKDAISSNGNRSKESKDRDSIYWDWSK